MAFDLTSTLVGATQGAIGMNLQRPTSSAVAEQRAVSDANSTYNGTSGSGQRGGLTIYYQPGNSSAGIQNILGNWWVWAIVGVAAIFYFKYK